MTFWSRWRVAKANPHRHAATGAYTDDEGARQSRQTQEFVNALADDPNKPGYKLSPIPVYAGTVGPVDRNKYSVEQVKLGDLKTRQPYVNEKKVRTFDRSKLPEGDAAHPLLVRTRDNFLVVDNGNHRVAHMLSIGMKETKARVVHEIHGHGGQGEGSIP